MSDERIARPARGRIAAPSASSSVIGGGAAE